MKLYLMQLGTIKEGGLPVPGYLIQTDAGQNILVDCGVSKELIGVYRHAPETFVKMDEDDYVVNQLARLNLTPAGIDYLVLTHFDPDHSGNIQVFNQAQVVVQRRLLEAARGKEVARFERTRTEWDAPDLTYKVVEGDTQLVEGVELIESGGHTPGHQSVLVRLPQTGPVLLTADAIPFASQTDPVTRSISPHFDLDEASVRESTRKLMEHSRREQVAMIVFGHDQEQWQQLRLLPHYYA